MVRIAVQNQVVRGRTGDEDPGRLAVVNVEPLDDVVVAADANAPGITDDLLLHPAHFDTADVDPARRHVEARHPLLRRQLEQIEDRQLAGVGEVVDAPVGAAALREGDAHRPGRSAEFVHPAANEHGVARRRRHLSPLDGLERRSLAAGGVIVAGRCDVVLRRVRRSGSEQSGTEEEPKAAGHSQ